MIPLMPMSRRFTVEQARELARRLNDVVTGVTFVKY